MLQRAALRSGASHGRSATPPGCAIMRRRIVTLTGTPMAASAPRALETRRISSTPPSRKATDWLDRDQTPDGFWVGMLESSYCMEAEWLLAMHFLGHPPSARTGSGRHAAERAADGRLLGELLRGAEGDINGTVECYAALRCVGRARSTSRSRARDAGSSSTAACRKSACSRSTGSRCSANGRGPRRRTCRPRSSRTRAGSVQHLQLRELGARDAVAARGALRTARRAAAATDRRLDELFPDGRDKMDYRLPRRGSWLSWRRLFLLSDRSYISIKRSASRWAARSAINACLVDRPPPRRRRRLGRNSTAVDLQPDGA